MYRKTRKKDLASGASTLVSKKEKRKTEKRPWLPGHQRWRPKKRKGKTEKHLASGASALVSKKKEGEKGGKEVLATCSISVGVQKKGKKKKKEKGPGLRSISVEHSSTFSVDTSSVRVFGAEGVGYYL